MHLIEQEINKATDGSFINTGTNNAPVTIDNSTKNIIYISATNLNVCNDCFNDCLFQSITGIIINDDFNKGRIRSSLEKIKRLRRDGKDNFSSEQLIKLDTFIARCYIRLGEYLNGSKILADTYLEDRDNPISIANYIISLILDKKYEEAFNLGSEYIKKYPLNIYLVCSTILSAQFIDGIKSVDSIINDSIIKEPNILLVKIFFLRSKNNDKWRELAINSYERYRDNIDLKLQYAEAKLSIIIEDINIEYFLTISKKNKEDIEYIVTILIEKFRFIRDSDLDFNIGENISLVHNIITALAIYENIDNIKEVSDSLIKEDIIDQDIYIRLARLCANLGLFETVKELQGKLPREVFFSLEFMRMLNTFDYKSISEITENDLEMFQGQEKPIMQVASFFSKEKMNRTLTDYAIIEYSRRINFYSKLILCNLALQNKYDESGLMIFKEIKKSYCEDKHKNYLHILANIAFNSRFFRDFIEMTNKKIHIDVSSNWLYKLVVSHANDDPIREDSVLFFKNIDKEILSTPEYARYAAIFYIKRNSTEKAIYFLEKVYNFFPQDVACFCRLVEQYKLSRDENKLSKILNEVDLKKLEGTPEHLIYLIEIFKDSKRLYEAINVAYKALEKNYPHEKAIVLYIESFFNLKDFTPKIFKSVTNDCYVTIKSNNGDVRSFLISDEKSNIFGESFLTSDSFSQKVLGRKVGEEFTINHSYIKESWIIEKIEDKYIATINVLLNDFNKKFPESSFLKLIKIDPDYNQLKYIFTQFDEDLKKSIDIIKFYNEFNIPLSIVSRMINKNSIEFSDILRETGNYIITCSGIQEYRDACKILNNKNKGITLDDYTAFICSKIDILDVLLKLFNEIFISKNCLEDITSIANRFSPFAERIVWGYKDGAIAKIFLSAEESRKEYTYFIELEKKLKKFTNPIAIEIPNNISDYEHIIISKQPSCLDAMYIAKNKGTIMLSDDMHYRRLCSYLNNGCFESLWIQVALHIAYNNKIISYERYSNTIFELIKLKHKHIFFDHEFLLSVYKSDDTPNLYNLKTVSEYIGNKDADFYLYYIESFLFFYKIWHGHVSKKERKATGILLQKLIRMPEYKKIIKEIIESPVNEHPFVDYVKKWIVGHFVEL